MNVNIFLLNGIKMSKKSKVTPQLLKTAGFIVLIILSIGDMATTYYAVSLGSREGNILPRYVIEEFGWIVACITKIVQIGIICWLLNLASKKNITAAIATLYLINGISAMTVFGNLLVINSY